MPNSINKLQIISEMLARAFSEFPSYIGDAIRFKGGFYFSVSNSLVGEGGPHNFLPLGIPIMIKNPKINEKKFKKVLLRKGMDQNHNRIQNDKAFLLKQINYRYALGGKMLSRLRLEFFSFLKTCAWKMVPLWGFFLKRTLDIIGSLTAIGTLFPVFLITSVAIKLDNPGPIFFSQIRVGKWGRLFRMYKFRSMKTGSDSLKSQLMGQNQMGGVTFKMKEDPRVTKIGQIIRKLSIDELPQLWNVLKGDMSLVGPRPPLPSEVEEYQYSDRRRLEVQPGITCIWQVSGRNHISFEGQVKLDVEYIENQSFGKDVCLLIKTIPAVLLSRGVY